MIVTGFILLCCVHFVFSAKGADVYYVATFSADVTECEDIENTQLDATGLILGSRNNGEATLGGEVKIKVEINPGDEFVLDVYKVLDMGTEFVFTADGDICENLDKEDTPWYPVFQSINFTSCPLTVGTYPVDEVVVNLDFAKDILCQEFCGEYEISLMVLRDTKKVACHIIHVAIVEKSNDD